MKEWIAKMKEMMPEYFKKIFPYFIAFIAGIIFGGFFI